jgi:Tfp pilus assembly protein PilP
MKRWQLLLIAGMLLLAPYANPAQDTNQGNPPPEQPAVTSDDQIDPNLLISSEFIYKPEGRRDPFWDLLRGQGANKGRPAIDGIGGLMIDELDLEGIIFSSGRFRALLKGPDSRPYVVAVGDKVYDGEIVSIDKNSIAFKKIMTVALGGQKEKQIIKSLNPEEEEKGAK